MGRNTRVALASRHFRWTIMKYLPWVVWVGAFSVQSHRLAKPRGVKTTPPTPSPLADVTYCRRKDNEREHAEGAGHAHGRRGPRSADERRERADEHAADHQHDLGHVEKRHRAAAIFLRR